MTKQISILLIIVLGISMSFKVLDNTHGITVENSAFTDARDGKKYDVVTIKIPLEAGISIERTWMAENLNYETPESFCYKDEVAFCNNGFGKLYTYEQALTACPEGWHLSTPKEWTEVFNAFGGKMTAGKALRGGGTSGLNIRMSGFGDSRGFYTDAGISANFWDDENLTKSTAGLITIQKNIDEVFHTQVSADHRNSCRCVQDY